MNERIRMDEWIGMELFKFGFDYVSYVGDLKVSVDGMVRNIPGSDKNVEENFELEPMDQS